MLATFQTLGSLNNNKCFAMTALHPMQMTVVLQLSLWNEPFLINFHYNHEIKIQNVSIQAAKDVQNVVYESNNGRS